MADREAAVEEVAVLEETVDLEAVGGALVDADFVLASGRLAVLDFEVALRRGALLVFAEMEASVFVGLDAFTDVVCSSTMSVLSVEFSTGTSPLNESSSVSAICGILESTSF